MKSIWGRMDSIGKYRIIKELGKGATAVVYLCHDPDEDRQVAVKLVRFDQENAAVSRRMRKLFRTERAVSERLIHPNIVRVFDAVVEKSQAFIVMEYVEGTSLEDFCRIESMLPLHRVIGIIFKCCMALDHAYRQGIIHRDIKPANILIDKDDNPKVADFGLAINIKKDMDRDSTFVMGVGSPAYMSPEQLKSYPLNQKTDLYSLGVVFFQLLTGRLPFRAKSQAALIYKIINTDSPTVSRLNPNLPKKLDAILKKSLEKETYSRYNNGAEFAKDLASVRYKIQGDEDEVLVEDARHFSILRKMDFFFEFENVELWEVLRSSIWRDVGERVTLMREGESHQIFGILVAGEVEVSVAGKAVCRLGIGEPVGEMSYLYKRDPTHSATVITITPCRLLEISMAALALASEELQERMQEALVSRVVQRLRQANQRLAEMGAAASQSDEVIAAADVRGKFSLELAAE
ncbi:MAG: serine/threonine-protein kinase [Betaproteobacteria bacterium]|nr:serine/threonine-protein kinase [Betaproteobacteria bacterium]